MKRKLRRLVYKSFSRDAITGCEPRRSDRIADSARELCDRCRGALEPPPRGIRCRDSRLGSQRHSLFGIFAVGIFQWDIIPSILTKSPLSEGRFKERLLYPISRFFVSSSFMAKPEARYLFTRTAIQPPSFERIAPLTHQQMSKR